jgi:hypothetical protein
VAIAKQGADFMRPMMDGKADDIRCSGIRTWSGGNALTRR